MNDRSSLSTGPRHTGHWERVAAHVPQTHVCPQGCMRRLFSLSMQITHASISFSLSLSLCSEFAESGGDGGPESGDGGSEFSGSEASSCRMGELASLISELESRISLDDGRNNIVGNSVDISACT